MVEQKLQLESEYCLNLSTEGYNSSHFKRMALLQGLRWTYQFKSLHYHSDRQKREHNSQLIIFISTLPKETVSEPDEGKTKCLTSLSMKMPVLKGSFRK